MSTISPPEIHVNIGNWNDTYLFFFCGDEAHSTIYGPYRLEHREWLKDHLDSLKIETEDGMTCQHDHVIFRDYSRRLIEMGVNFSGSVQLSPDLRLMWRTFRKNKKNNMHLRLAAVGLHYSEPEEKWYNAE